MARRSKRRSRRKGYGGNRGYKLKRSRRIKSYGGSRGGIRL